MTACVYAMYNTTRSQYYLLTARILYIRYHCAQSIGTTRKMLQNNIATEEEAEALPNNRFFCVRLIHIPT